MNSSIAEIIANIRDSQRAHIKLKVSGEEDLSLNCIFKEDLPPDFYLLFPPDTLPNNINTEARHPMVVSQDSEHFSFNSSIIEIIGDRRLHLKAVSSLDPSTLREYFRVNTSISISASHFTAPNSESKGNWTISGMTQDLSGSGVLALLSEEPKHRDNIFLELFFDKKSIEVTAHMIRKKKLRNNRWQVSFHFDNISSKKRDVILNHLFSEQRRQLRENVQVSNE